MSEAFLGASIRDRSDCRTIAGMLFDDDTGTDQDFFRSAARAALERVLWRLHERGTPFDWRDVRVLCGDDDELKTIFPGLADPDQRTHDTVMMALWSSLDSHHPAG